jgi:pyruvate carboxylase
LAPMSGGTSQPNLNTLVASLQFTDRNPQIDAYHLYALADYWRSVRDFYTPFESPVLPASADLYAHEMPGGQYTNLYYQAQSLGLADRWNEICRVYAEVNEMFGDIVKVTPTSKAVGDMALFMVANEVTPDDVLNGERELAFPASVVDLIGGKMGQPPGGFPSKVIERVLRGQPPILNRPGAEFPPADFEDAAAKVRKLIGGEPNRKQVLSYILYPKVFEEYATHQIKYSDTSMLPTPVFFYGLQPGDEISVEIEPGKTLIVKFLTISEPHTDGRRTVFFELNGQPRSVSVVDQSLEVDTQKRLKADPGNLKHVGAAMPGMVVTVAVQVGDQVAKGQKLLSLEAMKMESTIYADQDGKVGQIHVQAGSQVETGDLLIVFE